MANKWLEKIREYYTVNDDVIESYTEYFLIICRSIFEYIIVDFLDTINPKIKMIEKSNIVQNKTLHISGKMPINHSESKKIIDFLNDHETELGNFEKDLVVKYFIALRNWIVHSIFPHIYENQYDEKKVISRRFHRNFVSYLLLEQGGKLLLNNGFPLQLNGNDEGSFFDKYPLSKLDQTERSALETILKGNNPLDLMGMYLQNIEKFVANFESKY